MYNKTVIRFGFCDIQNNRGLGKGYQPQPTASADNPYLDLDYSGYHKTSSNNCLLKVVGTHNFHAQKIRQSNGKFNILCEITNLIR